MFFRSLKHKTTTVNHHIVWPFQLIKKKVGGRREGGRGRKKIPLSDVFHLAEQLNLTLI